MMDEPKDRKRGPLLTEFSLMIARSSTTSVRQGGKTVGRRTTFTAEVGCKICELLADGHSLLAISKMPGMPKISTLQGWAWNSEWSDESFVGNYTRARALQAHSEFDEMKETEGELKAGKIDPHTARVLLDNIKWRLSKMLPRVYGERAHIEHSGSLKVETVKDHAPEWMQEMLAELAPAAITAGDEDEDTIH